SLVCLAVAVSLGIGEVIARYRVHAWPFQRERATFSHMTAKETSLRWRFSPSQGRNSLGLSNREIGQKSLLGLRLLFLGDSLVWTGDTSSGELYTEVVERNVNAQLQEQSIQIEVINAGVPGYTTYQEVEFLKVYGFDMQPDVVLLGFVFNDVYYPYLHKPTEETLLDIEPESRLHRF